MTTDRTPPKVFKLTGELDLAREAELDAIAAAAAEAELAIVDMTEITFLDSTAIRWLVRTKQVVEENRGRLRVVAPEGVVTRLIGIAELEGVIEVFPTQSDAAGS
jgi:anti-sigma B factor antagonist